MTMQKNKNKKNKNHNYFIQCGTYTKVMGQTQYKLIRTKLKLANLNILLLYRKKVTVSVT